MARGLRARQGSCSVVEWPSVSTLILVHTQHSQIRQGRRLFLKPGACTCARLRIAPSCPHIGSG